MPFAVIGSEKDVETPDGRVVKGRQYIWGVAEVENESHCDFIKLRDTLVRTHMLDLIVKTERTTCTKLIELSKWRLVSSVRPSSQT